MSCLQSPRLSDDDLLSSPSSDEKMDTASESFRSTQHTPNSIPDVDHENDVLRLRNPDIIDTDQILDNKVTKLKSELNDSFISRFTTLTLSSPDNKARNIGISTPKYSSTLTLTTNHPLMGLASPDESCPVTKKTHRTEEEKDLSLSSIEDDRGTTNRYEFYTPQRNTSKNNLYFSENYVTADSQFLSESLNMTAEAKDQHQKRIIIPRFLDTPVKDTTQQNLSVFLNSGREGRDIKKYTEERGERTSLDVIDKEDFHSGVEYRDSPPRTVPSFDLPIEMSSNIGMHNGVESPDVESLSTQEDRSAYQALLDPYTGSVALRHTTHRSNPPRRKVQLPPEDDECSLDSVSGGSLESEDEPPPVESAPDPHSEDDTKRSKSTNTVSECSDPIPEYSAAEEFREERSWLSVTHGGGRAVCDMKVIEPFKRVVSHGGYEEGGAALIVFSACHLPDTRRPDYRYVMDNLFLYVMWSLERLVTDEYVLVYLHGSAGRRRMPTFAWLHECYKLVDRRLRKSLKRLYLVHPTFWLKSFVVITKPFVSYKFFRKLSYVESLKELFRLVPVEPNAIPDLVKEYDDHRKK
ncbi:protein prune homolog 2 [Danaus plexippus]|uniref:protein prune homolog 2 n=1 Tax=Danaus plexippus TaxID=13037 RepID=UPI002AAF7ED7|nr:protein prune homolog 2 [Danaus plexippus]